MTRYKREKTQVFGTPAKSIVRSQDVFIGEEGVAFAEAIALWNRHVQQRYGENSLVVMAAKLGDVKKYLDSLG